MALINVELPVYLMSSIRYSDVNGPVYLKAGHLITDLGVATAVRNVGGVLLPSYMNLYIAAATRCQQLVAQGVNDDVLNQTMRNAVDAYATGFVLSSDSPAMLGGGFNFQVVPYFQMPRKATITDAFFICDTVAASGESDVRVVQINNSTVSGTSVTYDSTKPRNTRISIPGIVGHTLNLGDELATFDTYTAGSTPALGSAECTTYFWAI